MKGYRRNLKGDLPAAILQKLPRSFDVVGSTAIIELPRGLSSFQRKIGLALLKSFPHLRTVIKKSGGHKGKFRLQKFMPIAGKRDLETVHKENGVQMKLDLSRTYFSPRLSSERKRIASQVKPGENVLVMFSGAGPYALVIAKNSKAAEVVAVEANRRAHKMAQENVKLNKLGNIRLIHGDVRNKLPKKKFDRIVMPLPKGAQSYLDLAIKHSKRGTMIHFYDFEEEPDIPEKTTEKIRKISKKARIIRIIKCGQLAPRAYRVCADLKIL